MKTNYHAHDSRYQQLAKNNFEGWGGEKFPERVAGFEKEVAILVSQTQFPQVEENSNPKILELGCGTCEIGAILAKRGYQVYGVDISVTAAKWAQQKFEQMGLSGKFRQGNVCEMTFYEDDFFDAVIDGNCMHCIIGDDRKRAFSEVYRIMKSGGYFHVSHMVGDPGPNSTELTWNQESRTQVGDDGVHYRHMPEQSDLIDELERAGWQVLNSAVKPNPWWDHMVVGCVKAKT